MFRWTLLLEIFKILNSDLTKAYGVALKDAKERCKDLEGDDAVPKDAKEKEYLDKTSTGRLMIEAKEKMDDALEKSEDVQRQLVKSLKYFGEDEKMPSNEFFGTLTSFVVEFDPALDSVNKAEERAEKEARLAAKRAEREKKKKEAAVKKAAKQWKDMTEKEKEKRKTEEAAKGENEEKPK